MIASNERPVRLIIAGEGPTIFTHAGLCLESALYAFQTNECASASPLLRLGCRRELRYNTNRQLGREYSISPSSVRITLQSHRSTLLLMIVYARARARETKER